jgi:recombination protein RecA
MMVEQKKIVDLENRKKALEMALAQIEKQFGKGSIMKLDGTVNMDVEAIPTGCLSLDLALGVGGVPKGRVIEIYGPESSGKTTLTLSIIAQVQKMGGTAAFIDAEHAFDSLYASKVGVKLDELLMSQPDTGEQALEITETLVRSNAVDLVVIDSVAALTPKAEIEGDMGDSHMGLQARLMSQALRKLTAVISKSKTCVIFINQIRMKIGVMFGSPETTTGGRALKFYASVRIDLRRVESIKQGEEFIGNRVKAKIVKNKVAAPFREAEFEIYFDEGISRTADILDMGVTHEIIQKAGAWLSFENERIGQGKENTRKFLKENPKVLSRIEKQLLTKLSPQK